MPLFLLIAGAAAIPIVSNAVDNFTEKPVQTLEGGTGALPNYVTLPLMALGVTVAVVYGRKIAKSL
jgi:hypothetical protein